ncbi:hypothetical protein ABZ208_14030 [Streptomyces sp. NPDC006208]|uniref:hypothetical protein n=1 Tax=Streptomyces sp. NPDC006208 TaxID=3156734 RepID=UPI0033AB244E
MTAADMTRMDRPASELTADLKALVARQRLAEGIAAEVHHLLDPADTAFAALACEHGDRCSTDDDYPLWADQLAARTQPGGTA